MGFSTRNKRFAMVVFVRDLNKTEMGLFYFRDRSLNRASWYIKASLLRGFSGILLQYSDL